MGRDAKILTGIGILTVIIVVIAAFTIGNQPAQQETKILGETEQKTLVRENSHQIKGQNAKVTIVEFGDFQCPACGLAHPIAKGIKNEYEGKINFVFRNFPLIAAHKNAMTAALAAESAGAQGKFWEMHDRLFEYQDEWSNENDPLSVFEGYAKEIGIDVEKFKKDVQDKKYEKNVQNDITDGYTVGVNSTPTFYINGKEFAGVLTQEQFKTEIENQLK
jgi:protein-disulfide isomerase